MASLTTANYINLGAYIGNFVITYLSNTGIFGETNAEVSKKYPTLVTPAGYAFSIWGLIFIAEGIFAIAQLLPRFRSNPLAVSPVVVASWTAACLFQMLWTLVFAKEMLIASAVLLTLIWASLAVLVAAQQRIAAKTGGESAAEYALFVFPFRVHFAWLTAATVVGYNLVVVRYYASDASLQLASGTISLVLLGLFAGFQNSNAILSAVLSWAIGAIAAELKNPVDAIASRFGDVVVTGIKEASVVIAIVLAVASVVTGILGMIQKKENKSDSSSMVAPLI